MIEKSALLSCGIEDAFRLFTQRVSQWWPASHRPSKDPASIISIEPHGRFWELAADGREFDLGHVCQWEPPHRLVLDFYLGTGPAHPTEVTITFAPEDGGTRLSIRHKPLPGAEDLWNSRAPVFARSWDSIIAALTNRVTDMLR